jgi:hypothetical protein
MWFLQQFVSMLAGFSVADSNTWGRCAQAKAFIAWAGPVQSRSAGREADDYRLEYLRRLGWATVNTTKGVAAAS